MGSRSTARTDIWAFGCVLYEMLAGRKAFEGDTIADCLAAIIGKEPDWTALPAPPRPRSCRCCGGVWRRTRSGGCRDIGEARRGLEDAMATGAASAVGPPAQRVARRTVRAWRLGGLSRRSSGRGAVGVRAIRQMTLKPEQIDVGLTNGEFIPSNAFVRAGTLSRRHAPRLRLVPGRWPTCPRWRSCRAPSMLRILRRHDGSHASHVDDRADLRA